MTPLRFSTGPVGAARSDAAAFFAKVLARRIGRPVDVRATPGYSELLETLLDGDAEFAWLPPAVYVRAEDLAGVVPLLAGIRANRAKFRGALFVPKQSSLRSLTDLRGRKVAWVDRNSCAGYLFPRLLLEQQGRDPDHFFSAESHLGTHGSVVDAVERGEADVGATFVHQEGDEEQIVGSGWGLSGEAQRMRIIATTEPIPSDALVAVAATSVEMRSRFTDSVATLHESNDGQKALRRLFGVARFEPTLPSRYASVRDAMQNA
jgi:phosphonate transport system substrate-binding protein